MPARRDLLRHLLLAATTTVSMPIVVMRSARADDGLAPRMAVASNFRPAMRKLLSLYAKGGHRPPRVVYGATGRLYAQIVNGAPYDALLAADAERPARLVKHGLADASTLFTYALGRLVLYSMNPDLVDSGGEVLRRTDVPRLAIANPRHAPYGRAAVETLRNLGLFDTWRRRLVIGENVAQTFHFVRTGAVPMGFVALSHVLAAAGDGGSRWLVPEAMHAPIRQQAVRLRAAPAAEAADRFLAFLKEPAARYAIRSCGYDLPPR